MSFVAHLNRWKRCFQSSQFSSFEKSSFSGRSSFNISSTLPLPQYQNDVTHGQQEQLQENSKRRTLYVLILHSDPHQATAWLARGR